MTSPMKLQLAYLTTDLSALALNPFAFTLPLIAGQTVWQPSLNGVLFWHQISHMPLEITTVPPIVCEKKFIKGFVDTDVAGTLNIFYSDNQNNTVDPPAATTSVKATDTIAIPANPIGNGTKIKVEIPAGKYIRVSYVNGVAPQTRFTIMLLICDENQ